MGLRINTNTASLNAQRNLMGTKLGLDKSLERLSSGFRINRAGDDAAGLAIFVVIGTDFDRNTVLLQPSAQPSARALYARQGPITDAELLDFGFTHADLF